MKIRTGDTVKVTAGKNAGMSGKVKKVFPGKQKVLVEGINVYKKHLKAQGERKPGGIVDIEKPLPIANLALLCPTCKQPTRVGWSETENGGKQRICRKCKARI